MKINSTELLVGSSLFCIQHLPCLVHAQSMNNILYRFIAAQTHFGMPRGAKMSLALNESK